MSGALFIFCGGGALSIKAGFKEEFEIRSNVVNNNVRNVNRGETMSDYHKEKNRNLDLEEKYHLNTAILESNPEIIIFALDRHYCYLAFNSKHKETMKRIWGEDIEIGDNILEIIGRPDDREKARINCDRALNGESFKLIEEYGDDARERSYWEDFWAPIFSDDGTVMGLTCFVQNISERKKAEAALDEELKFQEALLESIPGYLYVYDEAGRLIRWNKKHEEMTGYTADELSQMTMDKWFEGEDAVRVAAAVKEVFETGYGEVEAELLIKGDRKLLIRSNGVRLNYAGKTYFTGVGIDISQQRENEKIIRRSEAMLKATVANISDVITIVDESGIVRYKSPNVTKLFGWDPEELIGETYLYTAHPDDRDMLRREFALLLQEDGSKVCIEYRYINKDGKFTTIELTAINLINNSDVKGILANYHNITERKNIESKLRESEERFLNLFERAPLGYQSLDDEGYFNEVNEAWLKTLGYDRDEVIGKWFGDFLAPEYVEAFRQRFPLFKAAGKIHSEFEMMHKNGARRTISFEGRIGHKNDGSFDKTHCILQDITERVQTENALRESEEKYRLITENISDVIWVLNLTQNQFVYISPSITQLRGLTPDEAIKERMEDAFTAESFEAAKEALEMDTAEFIKHPDIPRIFRHEFEQPRSDGKNIWVEVSGRYRYSANGELELVGSSHDIEERKRSDERIHHIINHDQLTGLYNRRFYEEEMKKIDTGSMLPIALIMIDVNGLKLINDAFGHQVGDVILQNIANILKNVCNEGEVVSRIGGDEFIILLPQTDTKKAYHLVENINAAIAKVKIDSVILSVAIGFAIKHHMKEDINEVFRDAEDDLYRHKLSESSSMRSKTIELIMNSLFEKNSREMRHSQRVGELCEAIARNMELAKHEIDQMKIAGLMHDIGKIGIQDTILNKEGKLNSDEWDQIKKHSEIGYRILSSANEFSEIANYILEHQERWDGKGYPKGLRKEEISMQARIIAVADSYDAMTSDRTYRKGLSEDEAVKEIIKHSGTQFDPAIANTFVEKVLQREWK